MCLITECWCTYTHILNQKHGSQAICVVRPYLDRQTELLFRLVQSTSSKHINININCQRNKTVYNIVELVLNK